MRGMMPGALLLALATGVLAMSDVALADEKKEKAFPELNKKEVAELLKDGPPAYTETVRIRRYNAENKALGEPGKEVKARRWGRDGQRYFWVPAAATTAAVDSGSVVVDADGFEYEVTQKVKSVGDPALIYVRKPAKP